MGQIVMSSTAQIPAGYHLATAEELGYLPCGSILSIGGAQVVTSCIWQEGSDDFTYFCPDAPETVAPAPLSKDSMQHAANEFLKTGIGPFPATPPLDPKRAAGALKPQLQLIPPVFNEAVAAALNHGADKYGPWNWRENKVEMMTYIGAIRRHADAVLSGEDIDPDSGVHHLGHIAASCAIVLDAGKHGTLVDNRPPQKS